MLNILIKNIIESSKVGLVTINALLDNHDKSVEEYARCFIEVGADGWVNQIKFKYEKYRVDSDEKQFDKNITMEKFNQLIESAIDICISEGDDC